MSQNAIKTSVTGTVSGIQLSQNINAIADTLLSNSSGPAEPEAENRTPGMFWVDSSTTPWLLKQRNSADNGWIIHGPIDAPRFGAVGLTGDETITGVKKYTDTPIVPAAFAWFGKAIGEIFYLRDDLAGVTAPPTNSADYRYIKLTAADAYNTGVLVSESVTGAAPLVLATSVISLAGSPITGRTVNLINTERRSLRAGSSGVLEGDALQGHKHNFYWSNTAQVSSGAGVLFDNASNITTLNVSDALRVGTVISDATNGTVRIANETRIKSQGVTAYMRIK